MNNRKNAQKPTPPPEPPIQQEDDTRRYREIARLVVVVGTICILIFLGIQNLPGVLGALGWVLGIFAPLILGLALAMVLNVPMRLIERHLFARSRRKWAKKVRRPLAIFLSVILIVGIVIAVAALIIPELIEAIKILSQSVMSGIDYLEALEVDLGNSRVPLAEAISRIDIDWEQLRTTLQDWLANGSSMALGVVFSAAGSVVNTTISSFMALCFSFYILMSKETLKRQGARLVRVWLPERFGLGFMHVTTVWHKTFQNFIAGQTLEAVILGSLCMLGMLLLGLPYAPMIGALISVTAFIPIVGAFIGTAVGAFMILSVSPMQAVLFVVYLLILQQIEGNLIYPKVMGTKIQLPGMWVLAAVTVGGALAGAIGMLLAVPTAAAAYSLLREATAYQEKRRARKAQAQRA